MNFKKISGILGKVLSVSIVVVEILVILMLVVSKIQGNTPTLFGYQMYFIQTGSMEPELMIGDVIISKKYDGEILSAGKDGDIITYLGKEGAYKDKLITHRVVELTEDGIIAQGDANNSTDPMINSDDVKAVMVYKTVIIDKLYKITSTWWGFLFLIILPMGAMIVSEGVSLIKEIKNERKEASENEHTDKEE
jgi:signal peptidase